MTSQFPEWFEPMAATLTQEELVERAGLTAQAVGVLETGKRRRLNR